MVSQARVQDLAQDTFCPLSRLRLFWSPVGEDRCIVTPDVGLSATLITTPSDAQGDGVANLLSFAHQRAPANDVVGAHRRLGEHPPGEYPVPGHPAPTTVRRRRSMGD